jgi:uridine phosphorylase
MVEDFPLVEYDDTTAPVIAPRGVRAPVPQRAVLCFFREVIEAVCGDGRAEVIAHLDWEHGAHSLYRLRVGDDEVAVVHPGVGAPVAVGIVEELIASGCTTFVACGGAGAVVPGLALGHVIVPTSAVRDEGTSFHYRPASREIRADPATVGILSGLLDELEVPYVTGKTWTTDAPYRETRAKVAARREEGCITVEMETAAFLAVAQHRQVTFGQLLYAGDDLSGEAWDHRAWRTSSAREDLFWLAVSAVLRLGDG